MTAPPIVTSPAPGSAPSVLSGAQWEGAQLASASALASDDPSKATTNGTGRVLSGDEWSQAQRMTTSQVKQWKIAALPVSAAPKDMTAAPSAEQPAKGTPLAPFDIHSPSTYANPILRQLVNPALEHPAEAAAMTAGPVALAAASPVLGVAAGLGIAGSMVYHIAQYGWQKLAESQLDPATRKLAEQDPDRISGEAAAVQAAMLGLAPLIHVGVKAAGGIDIGGGMMEAGVQGVKESDLGPHFGPGYNAGQKTSDFAESLERGAAEAQGAPALKAPKGLEQTTPAIAPRGRVAPVEGLEPQAEAKVGKVAPIATEAASAPLQERADIDAAKHEYEARRVQEETADVAAHRTADAQRVLGFDFGNLNDVNDVNDVGVRRRPGGASPAPYFETPQGAEVLGAMAGRHGLPEEANPYHPASALQPEWQAGHQSAAESYPVYPEGFTMGGGLGENRIPPDYTPQRPAGFEPTAAPAGATPETAALAGALKPSRFRGHSTDDLVQVAKAARDQIEMSQRAVDESATQGKEAPPGGAEERASLHERSTVRAKMTLAQAEREFALRGITGDKLAQLINPSEDAAGGGVAPVEGTGPTRTRGLSAGVAEKALANRLDLTVGDLPEYRTLNMADQAARATALLASDPGLAASIARGETAPPRGILPETVFKAVEDKAIADGDVNTLRDLATSKLTGEATTMGQRIRALGERDPDSPVSAIQDIIKTRSGGADTEKAVTDEVNTITEHVAAKPITKSALHDFLDGLTC